MRLALVVLGTWIGVAASVASAQDQPSPTTPTTPTTTPAMVPTTPTEPAEVIPLSLGEAIALGIENNTDVQIVRFDPPIADYEHDAAWGAHDPSLFGDYLYSSSNIPTASALLTEDPSLPVTETFQLVERESTGTAGVRGLLPRLGWIYQIGYTGSALESNSPIQSLSTQYDAGLTGSLSIPLMRGAWWGAAWTQVEITGIGTELALEQFRQNLMDLVGGPPGVVLDINQSIEASYWTLAARKQELEVANKSLQTAGVLLEQTRAQYEVGVVSRVEVTEAEAGVADREFRQITAENLYRRAQDNLVDRVYGPRLSPTSHIEIEPTDRPEDYVTFALDPEASTRRALQRRPEIAIAQQQIEQSEILLKFAKNERLPQLDAVGSYGVVGLAGKPNPDPLFGSPLPDGLVPRDYTGSDDEFFNGSKDRIWTAGAVLSYPIPNGSARANVGIGELELRRAQTNLRRVEQDVVKEVRDAVRNLASALEGVQAAERAVAASTEQLRAERIRLEHGESTPFDVLLREENLVTAESQRIAALRIYHGSVTALDRAQGTLLEDRSIVLEDALPLR